jgi:hypothetical protein
MGIDAEAYQHNMLQILNGRQDQLITPPSVDIAHEVHTKTQMLIATEVMSPLIQLPHYRGRIPAGALMPWNPAVEQLGWPILATATIAAENDWYVGIKNGKWIGDHIHRANAKDYTGTTTMEKTWAGLTTYAQKVNKKTVLIHRGVDVPEKGDYRNAPVHTIAKRVKQKTGAKLYFDPSHAHGPKMKQQISYAIIDAMQLTLEDGSALYDGILVETGTSSTDTDQHISIDELRSLVSELARFRTIISRSPSS